MYKTKKDKLPKKPPISIDFDGVVHAYSKGFHDGSIYDEPIPGAQKAMRELRKKHHLYIYSSRGKTKAGCAAMEEYLKRWKIPFDEVVSHKPPARFYIDDRAIRFETWRQVLRDVRFFEKKK